MVTRRASPDFIGFYTYTASWTDNSNNEDSFFLYNFDFILAVPANVTTATFDSFDLSSFTPDPCFFVTAVNEVGESGAAVSCFPD